MTPENAYRVAQFRDDVEALQVACNTPAEAEPFYDADQITGLVKKFFDESTTPHMTIKLDLDTMAMTTLQGVGFVSELISKFYDTGFDLKQPASPGKSSALTMLFISRRI